MNKIQKKTNSNKIKWKINLKEDDINGLKLV